MVDIVEQLLFVATGLEHHAGQSTVASMVWEIVARELQNLMPILPDRVLHASEKRRRQPGEIEPDGRRRLSTTHHLLPLIQFLSQNDWTLRRFVRRMIVIDAVKEIQEDVGEGQLEVSETTTESAAGEGGIFRTFSVA